MPFAFCYTRRFDSEKLVAYEAGYRVRPYLRVLIDATQFLNVYDDVRSLEFGAPPPPGRVDLLNNMNARTYGSEVSLTYDVTEQLRVTGGYSYLHKRLSMDSGHRDLFSGSFEGNEPKHQFFLRQIANLPFKTEFDSTLRFVDDLPNPSVPHYLELDARLGWSINDRMEFSIMGQNLLDRQHPEFNGASPFRAEVLRNIYGQISARF
jgi:iron complex outermembrane receptor protein